ncbi:MAG: polyprenyl synthetase family protein [Halobacteriovoraceae bacterium]|nr:polyprenyl synthetase family protein [Halobacteriovoraceae bacterium]MBT5092896.1 polyprenyl synthetase family protein [Halobacteriovoraceae bacterium]
MDSKNGQEEISKLLDRTVLAGGKRLRPLLTHLMADLFGLGIEKVRPFARAIELVHAASLAHDDVVDNATTRRGIPSINIVGSNKKAVLAGDTLLADVIFNLAGEGNLNLVQEMSSIIKSLAQGEWLQNDMAESRLYTREVIEKIALHKTASVMSWCCFAPAYVSNSSAAVIDYTRQFGVHLGIAFQLMDDTLDFSDNSQKDCLLDLKNGLVNSVLFEWLLLNPELMQKFQGGEDLSELFVETNLDKAISEIEGRALNHLNLAKGLLEVIAREVGADRDRPQSLKPIYKILEYLGTRRF